MCIFLMFLERPKNPQDNESRATPCHGFLKLLPSYIIFARHKTCTARTALPVIRRLVQLLEAFVLSLKNEEQDARARDPRANSTRNCALVPVPKTPNICCCGRRMHGFFVRISRLRNLAFSAHIIIALRNT